MMDKNFLFAGRSIENAGFCVKAILTAKNGAGDLILPAWLSGRIETFWSDTPDSLWRGPVSQRMNPWFVKVL
jgi:hypothetical protein